MSLIAEDLAFLMTEVNRMICDARRWPRHFSDPTSGPFCVGRLW